MDAALASLIAVIGMLGATWLANRKSSKDMAAQWKREDHTRWDDRRIDACSSFVGQARSMKAKLDTFDTLGNSSLVTMKDIVEGIQTLDLAQGQVTVVSGSHKIDGAADEVLKAIHDYLRRVIQNRGRGEAVTEQENEERSTKDLADYVEYQLKLFTHLLQEQLGVAIKEPKA